MQTQRNYPPEQRDNLMRSLLAELDDYMTEEAVPYHRAFADKSLEWLGIVPDDNGIFCDGAGDAGIDFITMTGAEITIYQFKSQNFTEAFDADKKFGSATIADLPRIITFLADPRAIKAKSKPLTRTKNALSLFANEIKEIQEVDSEKIPIVRIVLCVLAASLTEQAQSEFEALRTANQSVNVFDTEALCDFELVTIDDVLAHRWRSTNSQWRDVTGKKGDEIIVHHNGDVIDDRKSMVFFANAKDLVEAYHKFGYRIFEANVRCEIKKSQVNKAIRDQISTAKGIDEFKYLNNGITVVCENRSRQKGDRIRVKRPGIVNGLQTITTLSDAYSGLDPNLRGYFDTKCLVLVRLQKEVDVTSTAKLVRATNNQNPMESRNLKSNEDEQILFERLFSTLGWFYERKQGAWDAFAEEPERWPTLAKVRKQDFAVSRQGKGRPTYRRVSNEELAQCWLALIGFVDEAAQLKRYIFSREKVYDRIFKMRPRVHAIDIQCGWAQEEFEDICETKAPPPGLMLLAYLTYRLARSITPNTSRLLKNVPIDTDWRI